jgi:hypothetical protein
MTEATGSGFEKLTSVALEQALRDSSASERPRCLEDTRVEHLRNLTSWGEGEWKTQQARVFWMDGAAGVGKSAIAQTWVDALDVKFGAAFFFSRANRWNQAEKFWPTISYQLSTKYSSFRQAVDATIMRDPLVLSRSKSLDAQFQDLVVKPLHASSPKDRKALTNAIIVIDGLDECSSEEAQRLIIKLVTTSAATGTTSFLWAFFTRPESHILSAFASGHAPKVCWHLTLPVHSPDSDKDIRTFLCDAFQMIRAKYPFLNASWPPKEDFDRLVKQCDGLFAYATNAMRFVDKGPGSPQLGPEERFQFLLKPGEGSRAQLPKLDQLYLLIMDQVPKDTLPTTLLILCANQHIASRARPIPHLSALFGFSQSAIFDAVEALYSVIEITRDQCPSLKYYHASFTDFLTTPERSTSEYCINTRDAFVRLYDACLDSAIRPPPSLSGDCQYLFLYLEQYEMDLIQVCCRSLANHQRGQEHSCTPDRPSCLVGTPRKNRVFAN